MRVTLITYQLLGKLPQNILGTPTSSNALHFYIIVRLLSDQRGDHVGWSARAESRGTDSPGA